MTIKINTSAGALYVEDFRNPEEECVVKVFDSEHKYITRYYLKNLYTYAEEMSTVAQRWWIAFCQGLKESEDINDVLMYLGIYPEFISPNEFELADYMMLSYEDERRVSRIIDNYDFVNKIGDYYFISDERSIN